MTRQTTEPLEHLNLSMTNEPLSQLVNQWKRGVINPNPPYQRGLVWTLEMQIMLIFSVLSGVPIPAFVTNRRGNKMSRTRYVIDGQQRLNAFRNFMDSKIMVPASWFRPQDVLQPMDLHVMPELAKLYEDTGVYVFFNGLSQYAQTIIENAAVPVAEGHFATEQEEAEIYALVNGGGTPQTMEDMERAARVARGES